MRFIKLAFIVIFTVVFGALWILSFYQFSKHPTREPKYINNEKEMAPLQPRTIPSS